MQRRRYEDERADLPNCRIRIEYMEPTYEACVQIDSLHDNKGCFTTGTQYERKLLKSFMRGCATELSTIIDVPLNGK